MFQFSDFFTTNFLIYLLGVAVGSGFTLLGFYACRLYDSFKAKTKSNSEDLNK